MASARLALLIILTALAGSSRAQVATNHTDRIIDRLESAMEAETADSLIAWTSDPVEIAIFGASRTYSRSQGSYVLRQFFNDIGILSFRVTDHSHSERGLFVEGRLGTEGGEDLRLYFRFREVGNSWRLMEILVERSS